ncbi:MAG: SagB/ThcOx family dehydrogenase [Gemmatimonadetes bacterium]|jgi:SagB-type dehydrogenase family enzyme|nr:SagB/ThcOx family dehydrogenase [Gemmatimonadota bacterium]MBT6147650.1 SagB/ThcOx family dehydrogenase [Gemmatimonadota bacterium]MBT7860040.1 SagB/ThcOx family dehydrogenase [Gemmatimonadota bacterium]
MVEEEGTTTVALNKPRIATRMSVEQALSKRRSSRTYTDRPVSLQDLGQLLWATQGITGHYEKRTAPSAGSLHQMSVTITAAGVDGLPAGIYRYRPENHDLLLLRDGDCRSDLRAAADHQEAIGICPVDFTIAGAPATVVEKYGDRGHRYLHMEAGHIAQNLYLQATALDLSTVAMAAFDDDALGRAALLNPGEIALYVMPVGYA